MITGVAAATIPARLAKSRRYIFMRGRRTMNSLCGILVSASVIACCIGVPACCFRRHHRRSRLHFIGLKIPPCHRTTGVISETVCES